MTGLSFSTAATDGKMTFGRCCSHIFLGRSPMPSERCVLTILPTQLGTRPRTRLPTRRSYPTRNEQIRFRSRPTKHCQHPQLRSHWCHRHPFDLQLRWTRICACRILRQQRVHGRDIGREPSQQACHRENSSQHPGGEA